MAGSSDKPTLLAAILSRRMLICFFNGFTSGLPLYFLYQLVPAWLWDRGVDLQTIGLFALVGIPYTWKFVWSPVLDRYIPPFLGRRRGWMLITQVALFLTICFLGLLDPAKGPLMIAYVASLVAFLSASQDIVLDAYRRELLPDAELGLGNSVYMQGYRVAGFVPGGLGLILADHLPWAAVHIIVASFMFVGMVKTFLISEAAGRVDPPKSLGDAVVKPFKEFFARQGVGAALLILAFMFFYKIGDSMATALSTPFYLDLGFTKTQIGALVKGINFSAMLVGTFAGGATIYKIGINRSLWIFGFVQMVSILGFALLSEVGNNAWLLGAVIAFEYLGVGLGAAALVAFMARATSKNFTATQFALFTSLIALPRTFANAITGFLVKGIAPDSGIFYRLLGAHGGLGYTTFFLVCTAAAIPGMVLLFWVAPYGDDPKAAAAEESVSEASAG